MNLIKNKKGDLMLDALLIILLLAIFFLLYSPVDLIITDIISFSSDSNVTWMLRAFTAFILLGIIKYIFKIGGGVSE